MNAVVFLLHRSPAPGLPPAFPDGPHCCGAPPSPRLSSASIRFAPSPSRGSPSGAMCSAASSSCCRCWRISYQLDPGAGRGARLTSIVAFAAALLCKAQAVPLPAALLILDMYPLRRLRAGWRPLLIEKLPYFCAGPHRGRRRDHRHQERRNVHSLCSALLECTTGHDGLRHHLLSVEVAVADEPVPALRAASSDRASLIALPDSFDRHGTDHGAAGGPEASHGRLGSRRGRTRLPWLLPLVGPLHTGNQLAHDRYSYLSGLGFAALAGGGLAYALWAAARGR